MDLPVAATASPIVADAAQAQRDRLLAALLAEEPSLVLIEGTPDLCVLVTPAGALRIVLVTCRAGAGLQHALERQIRAAKASGLPTHFVAVGGGGEVQEIVRRAAPSLHQVPMGFHHLDAAGSLVHVTGKSLDLLPRAAARLADPDPEAHARVARAAERGRQTALRERAVAARLRGTHPVTTALVVACVVNFALSYLWGGGAIDTAILAMGADKVGLVRQGQLYRLLAPAFLHFSVPHLFFNMVSLWFLGPLLETVLGRYRYLILYGACALGGELASVLFAGPSRFSAGASGAIWGLMTACFALSLRPDGLLPPLMAAGMRRRLGSSLVMNVLYSTMPGISMMAHLGGGIVGFVLMLAVMKRGLVRVEQRADVNIAEARPNTLVRVGAVLTGAAMALSVIVAIALGKPWKISGMPDMKRVTIEGTGLSLEVPYLAAQPVQVEDKDGAREVQLGEWPSTPMVIVVDVAPLPSVPDLDEEYGALEAARQQFEQQGAKGKALRMSLGGREVTAGRFVVGPEKQQRYVLFVGARRVQVLAYWKDIPGSWQIVPDQVVTSIAAP